MADFSIDIIKKFILLRRSNLPDKNILAELQKLDLAVTIYTVGMWLVTYCADLVKPHIQLQYQQLYKAFLESKLSIQTFCVEGNHSFTTMMKAVRFCTYIPEPWLIEFEKEQGIERQPLHLLDTGEQEMSATVETLDIEELETASGKNTVVKVRAIPSFSCIRGSTVNVSYAGINISWNTAEPEASVCRFIEQMRQCGRISV